MNAAIAQAMEVYDAELFVGGVFTSAGGTPVSHAARWNGEAWQAQSSGISGGPYGSTAINALALYRGELIVGGSFTMAGGQVSSYWARWGPTCPAGDLNCNQAVTPDDIAPFVNALLDPSSIDNCLTIVADVNHDGALNALDVQKFTACLLAGGCN